MRLQEVHPALVHFPIVLLPAALAADAVGAATASRPLLDAGRCLMPAAAASMAIAGLAGLAAQDAVKVEGTAHRLLTTHRNLNIALLALTTFLAGARARQRKPSPAHFLGGLGALALMTYTGYLGGKMVYQQGVGVANAGGVRDDKAPEIRPDNAGKVARTAVDDVEHALKHTAHHLAKGEIAPALGD